MITKNINKYKKENDLETNHSFSIPDDLEYQMNELKRIKEKKDLESKANKNKTNHSFSIPENIQEQINEKGFGVYNWIGTEDVKQSIQRDFLKMISSKIGQAFSVIFILASGVAAYISNSLFNVYFIGGLITISFFFIIYLTVLTISRANILRKNSNILITNSSYYIDGKIYKLEKGKIKSNKEIDVLGNLFEETLFENSNIHKTKKGLLKEVFNQLGSGFKVIFNLSKGRSKDSGKVVLFLITIYSIYALSLGIIYIIGIFLIWLFGIFISIINKQILLLAEHEITTITNKFDKLNKESKQLISEKNNLSILLKGAIDNEWKDSLLSKINSKINKINNNALKSTNLNISLKGLIKNGKYSEMFDFGIYNNWIKKQIVIPLEQIVDLLNNNLKKITLQIESNNTLLKNENDPAKSGPILASNKRLESRKYEINLHIEKINIYIQKLK